jgi:hypothetical protein
MGLLGYYLSYGSEILPRVVACPLICGALRVQIQIDGRLQDRMPEHRLTDMAYPQMAAVESMLQDTPGKIVAGWDRPQATDSQAAAHAAFGRFHRILTSRLINGSIQVKILNARNAPRPSVRCASASRSALYPASRMCPETPWTPNTQIGSARNLFLIAGSARSRMLTC